MASANPKKTTATQPSVKNGLYLVWLDDSGEQDPNAKSLFLHLFEKVLLVQNPNACLEYLESAEGEDPCMFVLVPGRSGQTIVPTRVQPLNQVLNIYVYCFDVAKHSQWAQNCSKVRCVESDFHKVFKCIQQDVQKRTNKTTVDDEQIDVAAAENDEELSIEDEYECFTDENNLFDRLAFELLIEDTSNEGKDEFEKSSQGSKLKKFQPDKSIPDWLKDDLDIRSNDFDQLYSTRWFLKHFYKQLSVEYEDFVNRNKDFVTYTSLCLTTDEFNRMKMRLGQTIICQEFLLTHAKKDKALKKMQNQQTEQRPHRVILEISGDVSTKPAAPYGEVRPDEILFWFGTNYRLMKMELIGLDNDPNNSYWLVGLNLSPISDSNSSIKKLYDYYLKTLLNQNDLYDSFGQILAYKGLYRQAEKWFEVQKQYEQSTELALRQFELNRTKQYIELLPDDSEQANILRAYLYLLTSNDNVNKARSLLMQIISEATDRLLRARANCALGYIYLNRSQQIDQAFDCFKISSDTLTKLLPEYHPDLLKAFLGLGYVYFTQEKYNDAEQLFERVLNIQKQIYHSKHPNLAKTKSALAHCLAMKKQTTKQAFELFDQAYDILVRTYPNKFKTHPEILSTKQDLEKLHKGKKLQARDTLLDYI